MLNNLVLFFTDGVSLQTWDSVGMFEREVALYKALQNEGVNVTFVTYGGGREQDFNSRIPGIRIKSNKWNLPLNWYQHLVQKFPPSGNVFKSNQIAGADVALRAAQRAKAKFVARCGYLLSEFQAKRFGVSSFEAQQANRLEAEVFKGADRVVVTTPASEAAAVAMHGIDANKVRVIPNYVETDRFRPASLSHRETFRIGFVGRLDRQKNLTALLEAVSGLDVELCLVGYGPLRADLEKVAEGIKTAIKFLGSLPNLELPEFLNSCDLFILPSLYEGHPKALLEAMACGLPVIGTRVPGIQELIKDGENGLVCELDPGSIRAAIQRALDDSDLRERLGKKARKYVEDNFSLRRVVNLELTLLSELSQ
jgi:glycosyltransferase involved in cell wall biosynthesis